MGSHQEGPLHHRRFAHLSPYLSSWDFRTPRAFSLIRTLGHLPLEVFPSDAGIPRDRSLGPISLPSRFSNSLADWVDAIVWDFPSSRDIAFRWRRLGVVSALGSGRRWSGCGGSSADGIGDLRNQNVGDNMSALGLATHFCRHFAARTSEESPKRVPQWAQGCVIENGEGAPRGCSSSPTPFAMNE